MVDQELTVDKRAVNHTEDKTHAHTLGISLDGGGRGF